MLRSLLMLVFLLTTVSLSGMLRLDDVDAKIKMKHPKSDEPIENQLEQNYLDQIKEQSKFDLAFKNAIEQELNLEGNKLTLKAFVNLLEEKLNIPFYIDENALEQEGIGSNDVLPINFNGKGRKISHLLDISQDIYQIRYLRKNGIIWVTTLTVEEKEENLKTKVYDLSWFHFETKKRITPKSQYGTKRIEYSLHGNLGGGLPSGEDVRKNQLDDRKIQYIEEEYYSAEDLIDLIQTTTGMWEEIDGAGGTIGELRNEHVHLLTITQSQDTLDKIDKLIAELKFKACAK